MAETKKRTKKVQENTVIEASAIETEASFIEEPSITETETMVKKEPLPPITNDYVVQVASAFHGRLIFKSNNTGFKIIWNEFGEENPFTVRDLFDMRNGHREFFTRNFITIEDPRADEVYKLLGVDKFYTHIRSVKDVDNLILNEESEKMREVIAALSPNNKEVVAKRAYELRKENILDSAKRIDVIEESTHIKLED